MQKKRNPNFSQQNPALTFKDQNFTLPSRPPDAMYRPQHVMAHTRPLWAFTTRTKRLPLYRYSSPLAVPVQVRPPGVNALHSCVQRLPLRPTRPCDVAKRGTQESRATCH